MNNKEKLRDLLTKANPLMKRKARDGECQHCGGLGCKACDARTLSPQDKAACKQIEG